MFSVEHDRMKKLTEQIQAAAESRHCMNFWNWCQNNPITKDYMVYIPHSHRCEIKTHKTLKGVVQIPGQELLWSVNRKNALMGAQGCVSDYFLAYPANGYGGLWLEAKPFKGKPLEDQLQFLDRMKLIGYKTAIAYGFNDMIETVLTYLGEIKNALSDS